MKRTLSHRVIAVLCALLLLASVLPMYLISFYNHPFYDDFGFTIAPHAVWRETGDVGETLRAGLDSALRERYTWQGTYSATLLSAVQPAIFSENNYYWTTVILLTVLMLGMGFMVYAICRDVFGADRSSAFSVACLILFLSTQLVPSASEAFFWHNGGFGYTFMAAALYLSLGVSVKLTRADTARRAAWLTVALVPLLVIQGGGGYPCGLLSVCAYAVLALVALLRRNRWRWVFVGALLLVAGCFLYNCTAPGNLIRMQTLGGASKSPLRAIAEAVYFGLALMGNFFSLPLLAALIIAVALLLPALRRSAVQFKHPLWFTLVCVGLFCAQLAPTLYTGNYLGDGRVRDVYWFAYVAMSLGLTLYWTGWAVKRWTRSENATTNRVRLAPLLVAAALLAVGCVSWKPEGAESYGPQNMAGGSALRSLLNGQAERYDAAMDARDAALNDASRPEVALAPVGEVPAVFMEDALNSEQSAYVLSLYAEYYGKTAVTIAGEE